MIDIRIMASPKREDNVRKILSKLRMDESIVCWDDRPNGGDAMYTAMKAWTHPISDDCTHRLVLQDDVEVCENFIKHATDIANRHPMHAVSLINFEHPANYPNHRNTPYYRVNVMPGCAIMLPSKIIQPCMQWCKEYDDPILKPHDDLMISEYCRQNKILMVTVIPSIVQHMGEQSLLSATYDWDRISDNFSNNPNADWGIHSVQAIR